MLETRGRKTKSLGREAEWIAVTGPPNSPNTFKYPSFTRLFCYYFETFAEVEPSRTLTQGFSQFNNWTFLGLHSVDSDTLIIFRFTQHKCTHCLRQTLNCILQSSTGTIWFHLGASVKRKGGELVLHSIHITIIKHSFFFYFLFKHKVFWVLSFGRQHELDTVYVEHRTRRTNDEQSLPAKCIVCEEKVCAVRRLHCVPCPVVFLFLFVSLLFSLSLALSVHSLSLGRFRYIFLAQVFVTLSRQKLMDKGYDVSCFHLFVCLCLEHSANLSALQWFMYEVFDCMHVVCVLEKFP